MAVSMLLEGLNEAIFLRRDSRGRQRSLPTSLRLFRPYLLCVERVEIAQMRHQHVDNTGAIRKGVGGELWGWFGT